MKKDGEFAAIVEPFGFKAEPATLVTAEELCSRKVDIRLRRAARRRWRRAIARFTIPD